MGTGSFTDQNDGEVADAVDVQQLIDAGKGDLVPRNSSGVATANAGSVGTDTYPWKDAQITTGYFVPGDVKLFHDFNGTLTPGQGWMKCNGDIVNETNYDAIHGAGSWSTYIGSSPIENKNLPDMADKYPVGGDTTTETGSSAMTSVGNSGNSITIANHTHTGPSHNHHWYDSTGASGGSDKTYNSAGTNVSFTSLTKSSSSSDSIELSTTGASGTTRTFGDSYTSNSGTGNTSSAGGFTNSIQPESHVFQYWMRII